jgi:glycosyltransferase involved in cell wall biosynthesis
MVSERADVLILNWRDTGHPEGGGSELYVDELAAGLARHGHRVTLVSAGYTGAQSRERRPDGIDVVRVGSRMTVYPRSAIAYLRGRLGHPQVVVEVQNGMPFLARLWARRARVIVLVHHVHREQWRVVMPAPLARIGWWIESRVAPRANRRSQYVAVSEATRRELANLGIPAERIAVIHNGTPPLPPSCAGKAETPTMLVVSRLVPHKRIEVAIDTLAALVSEFPDLTLTVAGRGWWHDELTEHAKRRGMGERIRFVGFVTDEEKVRLYQQAWVSLVPSIKEGWGLVVVEAGAHGTPSVGFQAAGGVAESIRDGLTGLLADDPDQFTSHVATLLRDRSLRERLGSHAADYARSFTWQQTVSGFLALLDGADTVETGVAGGHSGTSARRSRPRTVVHHRRLDLFRRRLRGGVDTDAGESGQDCCDQRS